MNVGTVERKGEASVLKPSDPLASLPCLTFNIPATSIPNVTQPVTHQCKADGNGHWEWVDTNSDFVESMATNLESQFPQVTGCDKKNYLTCLEAPISHL